MEAACTITGEGQDQVKTHVAFIEGEVAYTTPRWSAVKMAGADGYVSSTSRVSSDAQPRVRDHGPELEENQGYSELAHDQGDVFR